MVIVVCWGLDVPHVSFFNELAGVVGKVYARNLFWRDWGECFFSASGSEAGISLIRFVIFCVKGGACLRKSPS